MENNEEEKTVVHSSVGDVVIDEKKIPETPANKFFENAKAVQSNRIPSWVLWLLAKLGESGINPYFLFLLGFVLIILVSTGEQKFRGMAFADNLAYAGGLIGILMLFAGGIKIYLNAKIRAGYCLGYSYF